MAFGGRRSRVFERLPKSFVRHCEAREDEGFYDDCEGFYDDCGPSVYGARWTL